MAKETIEIVETLIPSILGNKDAHVRMINNKFSVKISVFNGVMTIDGLKANVALAAQAVKDIVSIAAKGNLTTEKVTDVLRMVADETPDTCGVMSDSIQVAGRIKKVYAKSANQKAYVNAMRKDDMVFGIVLQGQGRLIWLWLWRCITSCVKKCSKIILTRPAVEAGGENLGFLPGDINDKINPYLRPLYDALYSMMDYSRAAALVEQGGVIEVAPLAFMRGRTLNDAFIILDEAQNTTEEQMKMFLTRMGFQSKVVVTGDVTQIDLPTTKNSGLMLVQKILKDVKGVTFQQFNDKDVVRHPLVQRIVKAYDTYYGEV